MSSFRFFYLSFFRFETYRITCALSLNHVRVSSLSLNFCYSIQVKNTVRKWKLNLFSIILRLVLIYRIECRTGCGLVFAWTRVLVAKRLAFSDTLKVHFQDKQRIKMVQTVISYTVGSRYDSLHEI